MNVTLARRLVVFFVVAAMGCSDADTSKKGSNNTTNPDTGSDASTGDMSTTTDAGADDLGSSVDTGVGEDLGNPDAAECGNSIVESGEECDDGNTLEGDECLNDCTLACGDGVLASSEICDPGIAAGEVGACPADCDDMDACTTGTLQGTGCQAECVYGAITACLDDDGCCASVCDANTDNDCSVMCGNDAIEVGETCDPPGSCPTVCDDNDVCTSNVLAGAAVTCDAACSYVAITACVADGCCPTGCNSTNDVDCSVSCGNGVLEQGETCDPAGSCPTTCNDADACTNDVLTGSAANCNAACSYAPKTGCQADGCCVPGCNANNDADCAAVCGNLVVEPGETCDDGNTNATDGCDACTQNGPVPTAFMMTDLDVRDPHMFTTVSFFGCQDITNTVLGQDGVNPQFQNAIRNDGDNDGFLDLSLLAVFRPLAQAATTGTVDFLEADCTGPFASASCQPAVGATAVSFTYTNQTAGTCLDVVPGTVRATYTPAISKPTSPCFSTDAKNITLDLNGILVTLQDARFGATYVGVPATSLTNGLIRGFLTQATAEAIILPANLPLVGGQSLASILRGYATNCATGSDMDTHPVLGTGWWFYMNFPAAKVPFTP